MGKFVLNPDAPGARTTKALLEESVDKAIDQVAVDGDEPADLKVFIAPICRVCRRPLTDPASIAEGMGPVCRGKYREDG